MLIVTKDGQVNEVQYRYSCDRENDARHEMNSRKRSQGGDRKRVARKMKVKTLQIFIGYETPSAAHVSSAIIETGGFLKQSQ